MIRLFILLFIICFVTNSTIAQIFIHQPNAYYEFPYLEDGDGCHYFSMETDSSLLNFNNEFDGYIDLEIFDIRKNMLYFNQDEDDFYYCSYENEKKTKVGNRRPYTSGNKKKPGLVKYYDTIYVLRNNPTLDYNPTRRRGGTNTKEFPFEPIELITSFSDHVQESLINVQVEFREGDIISRKGKFKIICPYNIKADIIIELNKKLIKIGYLSNKKRGIYQEEIRDALYEFQEDKNMVIGFIDQETIDALKLDINLTTE